MDFDLEIISDEGDRPDPLFNSIMNAMNSMKEATADKIYQKIQKEGATNYSKPQVDRAIASALKYGIFEVRNNRYRVRDDILDDEDTVYWKLQKKKAGTPFRISEAASNQTGPKLDPESDNQRFKRPRNTENQECPHCGRIKRPTIEETSKKGRKIHKTSTKKRKPFRRERPRKSDNSSEHYLSRKIKRKRKIRLDLNRNGRGSKRRKSNRPQDDEPPLAKSTDSQGCYSDEEVLDDMKERNILQRASNLSVSDMNLLLSSAHSIKSISRDKTDFSKINRHISSPYASEHSNENIKVVKAKRSSISLKSESDSEKTCVTSASDDLSQSRTADGFFESQISNLQNTSEKTRNKYSSTSKMYDSQCERDELGQSKGDSDWLECSNEPQSTIIESNNVLTIKPIDSLAFKSPEQATYIS